MHDCGHIYMGVDVGVGSIGWALVRIGTNSIPRIVSKTTKNGEVVFAVGVRAFDVPEDPQTKELKNAHRREMRRQRVTIRRRRWRMAQIRALLCEHDLLRYNTPEALHLPKKSERTQYDPWELRVAGLDRQLTAEELAVVLIHIAKHRGFKSNSKRDRASASSSETGQMLAAISTLEERMRTAGARTVGEYLAGLERKRNRAGADGKPVYDHTVLRSLLEKEIRLIFQHQADMGQENASAELLESYLPLAFDQLPLQSRESLVGRCTFEPEEKRAPACSYTAECFRLAQRLVNVRLRVGEKEIERLSPDLIHRIVGQVGTWKKMTYKKLKKLAGQEDATIEGLDYGKRTGNGNLKDPETADVVGCSEGCAAGSNTFYKLLGKDVFHSLINRCTDTGMRILDALAQLLSVNDDIDAIYAGLEVLPLAAGERSLLKQGVTEGVFARFRGTVKLSFKAMDKILPEMIAAGDYAAGCANAGYDHAAAALVDPNDIRNPVVQRIMREFRRQVRTVIKEFGVIPDFVHVEMLRDVGKSSRERNEIDSGMKRRFREKQGNRTQFAALVGKNPESISATELMRYELWREQQERCAYYLLWKDCGGSGAYAGNGGKIAPHELLDGANSTQIDHILPRSRTADNKFANRCLVRVEANQAKGDLTPWEWIGASNPEAWHAFEEWVRYLRCKGIKKRNYLLKNLDTEMEGRFHERNKNDTSYAARLILRWLEQEYACLGVPMVRDDGSGIRRFFARPGSITALLRRAWGVEDLKKDNQGNRVGDKHHALDALVVALCSESLLQRLTRAYKRMENWKDKNRLTPHLELPWPKFRQDMETALASVFVSRAERGKESGALHEATLRQIREETDAQGQPVQMLYERIPLSKLTPARLNAIKDVERNGWLRDILAAWLEAESPMDKLPESPSGDAIKHVRVRRGPFSSGIAVPRGSGVCQADNEKIVRTDVFCKDGAYYLVLVYTNQLLHEFPPHRAVTISKEEKDWQRIDSSFEFLFSLMPNSYVIAENAKGVVYEGYFIGSDRSVAAVLLARDCDHLDRVKIGVKRLKRFEKYRVDRLGRLHKVTKETRIWRGAACT